jgi:hypothetical protein
MRRRSVPDSLAGKRREAEYRSKLVGKMGGIAAKRQSDSDTEQRLMRVTDGDGRPFSI